MFNMVLGTLDGCLLGETVLPCPRCHLFLKACRNCVHFEGTGRILGLAYASEVYPGNRCPQFEFRKTCLVLR